MSPGHGDVVSVLSRARLPLHDEKEAQTAISAALTAAGISHEREVRLSSGDIPDFMLADGLVVEVKLKGSRRGIFRQLERYATYERVNMIVLATSRSMQLPSFIKGKPAFVVSLSVGWL